MNESLMQIYMASANQLCKSLAELEPDDVDKVPNMRMVAIVKIDSLACEKAGREWRASVTPDRKPRIKKPSAFKSSMP